jgi:sugar phosphate isomerase/epimerase
MTISRRRLLRLTVAGIPAFAAFGTRLSIGKPSFGNPRLGVQTYSFRDMLETPGDVTDKMIAAMHELGLTECEMFEPMLQPPALSLNAPWRMTGGKPTEASLRGAMPTGPLPASAIMDREAVRQWRLGPGLDHVGIASEKFRRAGIRIFAFNYLLKDNCTDEEVDRGFEMTRACGTRIMTASTTLTMARRTIPFVEKHEAYLAFHGHSNLADPDQFATPQSFVHGLALSRWYKINLDIGHFSAAGFDSVAFIRAHHDRISNLHVKDRKNNNGPNVPLGEGDTPIRPVLELLKRERYAIPVDVEYEYAGSGTSTQEIRHCLDYVKAILAV